MAKTATPKKPHISGFCNVTLPRTAAYDPHTNCRGCDCPCHTQEDPVPVHIDPEVMQANAAALLTPTPPAAEPDDPDAVVDDLRDLAEQLNVALHGYHPEDWRDAVRLLHRLRQAIGTLKMLDSSLVHWLYLHGEHGLHQHIEGVPGEFAITRGRAKERWDAEGAVRAYVEAQLRETGEVPDPLQVMAWVLEVLPATQSTSLRKTPLRRAKIDLEDYYWSEPGTLQVSTPTT